MSVSDAEWQDVFDDFIRAANERELAKPTELLDAAHTIDDGVVTDQHVASYHSGATDDHIVS